MPRAPSASMRLHPTSRDRHAAILFALLALGAFAAAVASGSPVLWAVTLVTTAAALLALRGYPIDRNW